MRHWLSSYTSTFDFFWQFGSANWRWLSVCTAHTLYGGGPTHRDDSIEPFSYIISHVSRWKKEYSNKIKDGWTVSWARRTFSSQQIIATIIACYKSESQRRYWHTVVRNEYHIWERIFATIIWDITHTHIKISCSLYKPQDTYDYVFLNNFAFFSFTHTQKKINDQISKRAKPMYMFSYILLEFDFIDAIENGLKTKWRPG